MSTIDEKGNLLELGKKSPLFKNQDFMNCKDFLASIKHYYLAFAPNVLIKTNLLIHIRFPEFIINEDLYFAFECFLNASNIASVDSPTYLYRQRAGSISHAQSFHQHKLPLLAKSYLYNANYLLQLLKKYPNESFTHLIDRCLRYNASPAITFCILSNTSKKSDLKILLPYANSKAKLCFYFPFIFKALRSAKLKLKSIQSYFSSKITQ
ncbi:hypothetical protein CQA57_04860 [Helicobacter anseris]|uniref:Glycosyl transferase n=1 Tax=Helicobacter anseris TaxID=375926 RepID=A0A3D8J8K3_9HELI|nr:hypothetical protein [Helicobacter anseris]RDU73515.1 hypothetical protein CQA57_04860 [Helicobacter anseris]